MWLSLDAVLVLDAEFQGHNGKFAVVRERQPGLIRVTNTVICY